MFLITQISKLNMGVTGQQIIIKYYNISRKTCTAGHRHPQGLPNRSDLRNAHQSRCRDLNHVVAPSYRTYWHCVFRSIDAIQELFDPISLTNWALLAWNLSQLVHTSLPIFIIVRGRDCLKSSASYSLRSRDIRCAVTERQRTQWTQNPNRWIYEGT